MEFAITGTDIVAGIGAVSGSAALIWEFIKWRHSGPKFRMSVTPGMKIFENGRQRAETFIILRVENYGDKPTTIDSVFLYYYASEHAYTQKKYSEAMMAQQGLIGQTTPHFLSVGTKWVGSIEQTVEIEKMAKEGILICEISHVLNEDPLAERIKIDSIPHSPSTAQSAETPPSY